MQSLGSGPPVSFESLVSQSNLPGDEVRRELQEMVQDGSAVLLSRESVGPGSNVASMAGWAQMKEQATRFLEAYHSQYPLRQGVAREELRGRLKLASGVFPHALKRLADEGVLEEEGPLVRTPEHQPRLTPAQEQQVFARGQRARPATVWLGLRFVDVTGGRRVDRAEVRRNAWGDGGR